MKKCTAFDQTQVITRNFSDESIYVQMQVPNIQLKKKKNQKLKTTWIQFTQKDILEQKIMTMGIVKYAPLLFIKA